MSMIASSGSLEGVRKLISQFYYSPNIKLVPCEDTSIKEHWDVHNAKGQIQGVWVVKKGRRFIFEDIPKSNPQFKGRGKRMPVHIPGTYQKSYSWQSPDGKERGTFRKNPGLPKFAYKDGEKCHTLRVNPVKWVGDKIVYSANLFVGFSVKNKPTYNMDDLVTLVKKVRKRQVKHPDSSFVYQKGVYTHEQNGMVVTEDAAQVVLFNVPPMQKNFTVFRKHMMRLAEIICEEMKQETVILRIDKNGTAEETLGMRA